jgi:hypothetical protein
VPVRCHLRSDSNEFSHSRKLPAIKKHRLQSNAQSILRLRYTVGRRPPTMAHRLRNSAAAVGVSCRKKTTVRCPHPVSGNFDLERCGTQRISVRRVDRFLFSAKSTYARRTRQSVSQAVPGRSARVPTRQKYLPRFTRHPAVKHVPRGSKFNALPTTAPQDLFLAY